MLSDFDLEGKNKFQKAAYYLKYYGASYTVKKALRKLGVPIGKESEYMTWCRRTAASKEELRRQREDAVSKRLSFVIVPEPGDELSLAGWKNQTCEKTVFAKVTEETKLDALLKEYDGDWFVFSGKEIKALPEYLYHLSLFALGKEALPASRIRREEKAAADLIYTDEDNCVEIGRAHV